MDSKICSVCLEERELIHFDKHKNGIKGVMSKCKDCRREYARKYQRKLKEEDTEVNFISMRAVNKSDYCEMYSFLSKIGYNVEGDVHTQFLRKWNLDTPKERPRRAKNRYSYKDCCKKNPNN